MIKQILKLFGKTIRKTTETVGKSLDFIDDTLEKEHILTAAEKTKEVTSKVINKAGETFQQTKNTIDDITEMEQVAGVLNKVKEVKHNITVQGADLIEKGREKIEGNEKVMSAIDKISETGKDLADSIGDQASKLSKKMEDSIFGEEEE